MEIPWEKISIAPMMDITDRRFRYFMRLINPRVRLYTEMIVSHAIVRGDRNRLLKFDAAEHPVVLQLGGDDPAVVAEAAKIGADFGYDAIDLNCGCPSDRVESGNFGVCLMRMPERVAEIVAAVHAAVKIPVSVKCRIGITGEESEAGLIRFAENVFAAGARWLTVHARTATLGGLSPKQNREIPPLNYEMVYRLKEKFPDREIEINGGIKTRAQILAHLGKVDRVMIGRLAHEDPFFFAPDFPADINTRLHVLDRMAAYASQHEHADVGAARFFSNMLNTFHALPGARLARRFISEEGRQLRPEAAVSALKEKMAAMAVMTDAAGQTD
ncbi:MAG: tRNA dihydrouridine(20/20a) synthase DusA [Turneriella sp.]|nr:tRNA dihydrouridine(20/20a) synthase DusA [Turneriella sp.]